MGIIKETRLHMNHIALTVLTLDQLTLLPSSILPFVLFFQFVSVFRSMTELDIERSISFDSNVFASTDFVSSGKDQSDSARRIIRWTNCIKLFRSKVAGVPSCSIEVRKPYVRCDTPGCQHFRKKHDCTDLTSA